MAMMHSYGRCASCGAEGALWRATTTRRRFWIFGPRVPVQIMVCDECDHLFQSGD